MLEYEKKVLLTKNEYVMLADKYIGLTVESQVNYYFDTDDLYMNRNGISCRIRAKKGRYKTTIKNHGSKGLNCRLEEDIYEGDEFDSSIFDALGLHFQGRLVTKRTVLHRDAFCEVVLDRNSYLGYEDFEIEAEYVKGYEKIALNHLRRLAESLVAAGLVDSVENFLRRVGKDKPKSERFFDCKRAEGR